MLKTKQKVDQPLAAFAQQFCNDLTSINANGGVNGQKIKESNTIIPFIGLLNSETRKRPSQTLFLQYVSSFLEDIEEDKSKKTLQTI